MTSDNAAKMQNQAKKRWRKQRRRVTPLSKDQIESLKENIPPRENKKDTYERRRKKLDE
jgi:hypothetical protein